LYVLLYQNHTSRLKTLKCGDFYCRAFLSRENHSFIWLTQSRRIVGRHTDMHTYTHIPTYIHFLSFPLPRSHPFSLYFHHKTSKLYAMLGRFDCAVLLHYVSRIRVCRTLIIDLFDWETSNTLLIRLKHDPSIFWLIPKSSIARSISFFVSVIINVLSSPLNLSEPVFFSSSFCFLSVRASKIMYHGICHKRDIQKRQIIMPHNE